PPPSRVSMLDAAWLTASRRQPASPRIFFSSRRRHTRWPGDWSSDVCSSDLLLTQRADDGSWGAGSVLPGKGNNRSEERRVGQEWRSPWSAHHLKTSGRR